MSIVDVAHFRVWKSDITCCHIADASRDINLLTLTYTFNTLTYLTSKKFANYYILFGHKETYRQRCLILIKQYMDQEKV